MQDKIKVWWSSLEKNERSGLLVLGVIMAGVFLLSMGIKIGEMLGYLF
jgi:hypothetical protein